MESKSNVPEWMHTTEIEVVYKTKIPMSKRPKLSQSADVVNLLRSIWNPNQLEFLEECYMLLLNQGNRVLGFVQLSKGGISGTVVDPRIVFGIALKVHASCIILAHNHPSGAINPSAADIKLTEKIKAAATLLDIKLLDHIILSTEGYYSFADEGAL
jgi:DNA repair protein RadC